MSLKRILTPTIMALGLALSGQALAAGTEPPLDTAKKEEPAKADASGKPGAPGQVGAAQPGAPGQPAGGAQPGGAAQPGGVAQPGGAAQPPGQAVAPGQQPPADKGKKNEKKSEWRDAYRVAVSYIQGGRYDDGIAHLTSLDKADSPDVLNYIGYANRKMGRMEEARVAYEAALTLDPNHRGALEYYGEWHVEMGRLDDARRYLGKLASVCGTSSREYQDLAEAISLKTVL